MKTGLVLEGGSFRGIFTAGVLDYFLDKNISFPYVVGVSSGAANAVNYIAGQKERTKKVIMQENSDHYFGLGQMKKSGKLLDLDKVLYEYSYTTIPFDFNSYFNKDTQNEFVVANCENATAEYLSDNGTEEGLLKLLKATCSVPMMCNPVNIDGKDYMDGSTLIIVPFERALSKCDRAVVILTRHEGESPTDYSRMKSLFNICYHNKYPELIEKMAIRRQVYEEEIRKLAQYEKEGKVFILSPKIDSIKHFENSADKILSYYNHGYELAKENEEGLREFLKG